jgi:hypothetical protein
MLFFAITVVFFGLCNGITLDCTFKQENYEQVGNTYICDARVTGGTGNINVTSITGGHWSGRNNNDVKGIQFNNQNLNFIPRGITSFFGNINTVRFLTTPVRGISKFDLQQFGSSLKHFVLYNNGLEAVDGDLFSLTRYIQFVSFGNNKITNVGPNIFGPLVGSLSELDFSNNLCVNWRVNNVNGVTDVKRRLNHACPPTADMIERIVVDGSKLANKVDERFDTRFNSKFNPSFDTRFETKFDDKFSVKIQPVTEEVSENFEYHQSRIRRLEVRVAELEAIILEIDAWKSKLEGKKIIAKGNEIIED